VFSAQKKPAARNKPANVSLLAKGGVLPSKERKAMTVDTIIDRARSEGRNGDIPRIPGNTAAPAATPAANGTLIPPMSLASAIPMSQLFVKIVINFLYLSAET
jgi:hypothetical protein